MKSILFKTLVLIILKLAVEATAAPISGNFNFGGVLTAYSGSNGTGSIDGNYATAKSIVFGRVTVGSVSGIAVTNGDSVFISSPMNINPTVLLHQPLLAVDNYIFTASSISQIYTVNNAMAIQASGIISDGNPSHDSSASFTISFTLASSGSTTSFGCSGAFAASGKSLSPPLNIQLAGNKAALSWPTNDYNYSFSLQSTTNLTASNSWTTLTNSPVIIGTNNVISNLAVVSGNQYYRLIH